MKRFFHGGPAGIPVLGLVQPPSVTGARSTRDVAKDHCSSAELLATAAVYRDDRVYVTTDPRCAALFACWSETATVYEVEPLGDLAPDPDCNTEGLSFACARARVVRARRLTSAERDLYLAVLAHPGGAS